MKSYFESLSSEERKRLADEMGTSVAYLSQIAHSHRQAGPAMAKAIEEATAGAVKRHELRPDIFDPPAVANGRAA